jgi:polyphosphate kinase 2 (PPK2 family)
MFDAAEIGGTVEKDEYKARMPDLRAQLLETQFQLKNAGVPVLIVVAGDDRIGSEETIDRLNEWLDARYVDTQVFEEPTDERYLQETSTGAAAWTVIESTDSRYTATCALRNIYWPSSMPA